MSLYTGEKIETEVISASPFDLLTANEQWALVTFSFAVVAAAVLLVVFV